MKYYKLLTILLLGFIASCGALETKTGGSYQERQMGKGGPKMWGCLYSGTHFDYLLIKDVYESNPGLPGGIFSTFVAIDLPFTIVMDTIFLPGDIVLKIKHKDKLDGMCANPLESRFGKKSNEKTSS